MTKYPSGGEVVTGTQLLYNQGATGRTLALGGFQWTANPSSSTHLSGTTNPLESNSAPSALAVPNSNQDWGYNTSKYGYDTGGVTLALSPTQGTSDFKILNDASAAMTIQFTCTAGGATGARYLYLEFMGRVIHDASATGTGTYDVTLTLTPAQQGWMLAGGGFLKYRMYAMNNENAANIIQVNILPANGLVVTHFGPA